MLKWLLPDIFFSISWTLLTGCFIKWMSMDQSEWNVDSFRVKNKFWSKYTIICFCRLFNEMTDVVVRQNHRSSSLSNKNYIVSQYSLKFPDSLLIFLRSHCPVSFFKSSSCKPLIFWDLFEEHSLSLRIWYSATIYTNREQNLIKKKNWQQGFKYSSRKEKPRRVKQ